MNWARRAADQDVRAAAYFLGICYRDGYGVAQDPSLAARWCDRAAEAGHAALQFYCGALMLQHDPEDARTALGWIARAADQGHTRAIALLTELSNAQQQQLQPDPES